jgi:hypothetical protein
MIWGLDFSRDDNVVSEAMTPRASWAFALEACRISVVTLASEKVNSVVGIASWDVG